jgi:hypothetical protein
MAQRTAMNPPDLKITEQGVENFDEIRRWALMNDATWMRFETVAMHLNLSESEKMKLLAVIFFTESVQYREMVTKLLERRPPRMERDW